MDLRNLLDKLRERGELIDTDEEVSWNLEAGAYAAMACRVEKGNATVLFNNVKGYKDSGRLLANFMTSPRQRPWKRPAFIMDMDENISWPDFRDEFIRRIEHPLKPILVEGGGAPCKENVMMGKDVNLFNFPFPYLHQVDGGRYGTVNFQIVEDPDTGWVNWGNYRTMLLSKNRFTGLLVFGQHGPTIYYTKYEAQNKPCPFCYVTGGDPAISFAAGLPLPAGVCEADYVGGLRQEPLKLVRAETNNLYVPADAELVIEGVIMPGERADEGPTGEMTGYMHTRASMPVYHVQCITYRNNPIIPFSFEGVSFNDNMTIFCSASAAEFYRSLRDNGFPVKDVKALTESSYSCLVVSTEVPYEGYIDELRNFMDSSKVTLWGSTAIIVDADVDIASEETSRHIYEEISTKIDPRRDLLRTDSDAFCTPLNPAVDRIGRKSGVGAARITWDCTTPLDWDEDEKIKILEEPDLFTPGVLSRAEEIYERYEN